MGHGSDWGGFAFWIFIAACAVAGIWEKIRRNAERHQTLRTIIEKTGKVDEAQLKELFRNPGLETSPPGEMYRALRIGGTIVMSVGAALAVFCAIMGYTGFITRQPSTIGLAAAVAITMIGMAIFMCSRYATRPPGQGDGSSAGR